MDAHSKNFFLYTCIYAHRYTPISMGRRRCRHNLRHIIWQAKRGRMVFFFFLTDKYIIHPRLGCVIVYDFNAARWFQTSSTNYIDILSHYHLSLLYHNIMIAAGYDELSVVRRELKLITFCVSNIILIKFKNKNILIISHWNTKKNHVIADYAVPPLFASTILLNLLEYQKI